LPFRRGQHREEDIRRQSQLADFIAKFAGVVDDEECSDETAPPLEVLSQAQRIGALPRERVAERSTSTLCWPWRRT
jgi:hypothetical protein